MDIFGFFQKNLPEKRGRHWRAWVKENLQKVLEGRVWRPEGQVRKYVEGDKKCSFGTKIYKKFQKFKLIYERGERDRELVSKKMVLVFRAV